MCIYTYITTYIHTHEYISVYIFSFVYSMLSRGFNNGSRAIKFKEFKLFSFVWG